MGAAILRLAVLLGAIYVIWRVVRSFRKELPVGPPSLRVVEMKRSPYDVLGVPEDATRAEIEAARDRLLSENDPSRVEGMSDEIRKAAQRVCEEVNEAYAELIQH